MQVFKTIILSLSVVVSSCLLLLPGCQTNGKSVKEDNPEDLRKELAPTVVAVVKALKKPFNYQLHTNGVVEASAQAEIIFNANGIVEKLFVTTGEKVSKGQIIAKINNSEQTLALERAKVSLKEKQLEYESQVLAMGHRSDSSEQIELYENLAYVSGLKAAEVAYRQAKLQFDNTIVKVPIGGVIADLQIKQGATISSGDKLCIVYNTVNFIIETEVLESVITKVAIGQQAIIKPLAFAREYKAIVQSINPRVNKNGTVKLTLRLLETSGLMPGMNVGVIIYAPYNKNIIVPETALVIRSGKEVVFVAEDGLAKWHYVTTGLKSNNEVEILTGLKEGDKVIITNNIYLAHDTPVEPQTTNDK